MRHVFAALSFAAALLPLPALAHPHIFVDAQATISFNDAGQVVGVHNQWTFDEAYSAWAVQGLDTNADGTLTREELQPLADDNMQGLSEYEYYTFAGEGPDNLKFAFGSNPLMEYAGGRQTLSFDVALEHPYLIQDHLELAINDPEYYVAISFGNAGTVKLVNAPPNCSVSLTDPTPMSDELSQQLYDLGPDVVKLPPDLEQQMRGVQGAILVACPGGSATGKPIAAEGAVGAAPTTALDAATQMAEATPNVVTTSNRPMGGPPPEPGLVLPKTGILGWVSKVQADFYQDLVKSLDLLKTDWTAFWVLGGLSFLYGIFHAAGPGHGKVVISSYVLANERQMRRGVLLSFLSAMMQSLVAIGFVLIASLALGMTSMAMNDAARWIGILSYAMIVLLGIWLVARKVFRLGHQHRHHEAPAASRQTLARRHMGAPRHALAASSPALTNFSVAASGLDRFGRMPGHAHYGHDHGDDDHDHHDHVHIVTPDQLRGGWREQLGVVFAVGLRPCSGALIVLAFALSQGLLAAGILAVLLMGLGTAITTGTLAALAVGAKGLARTLAGADNPVTSTLVWWAELLAAFGVVAFGVVLLLASL